MPRRLTIAPHVPVDELERRYRGARDPVARGHWQIVWLLARGRPAKEVAAATGDCVDWVRELAHRYNAGGGAALGDRRRANPGAPPLLDAAGQAALRAALAGSAPDGGLWSGRKVAAWIAARVGRPVPPQRGWAYLRRLGHTPQVPRPRHAQGDRAAQEAFKRGAWRPPSARPRGATPRPRSRRGPSTSTGSG